ncbi:MAG: LysR family substrate-binding domain-containing protein [Burkholderiaceae bacterium]
MSWRRRVGPRAVDAAAPDPQSRSRRRRRPILRWKGRPLERDDFALAVSARTTLGARDAIALAEAANEPFIMYPADQVPGLSALALLRCQLSGFRPQIEQEARQVQTIMNLVASGLGVGLVASVARQAAPPGVKCLRLTDTPEGFHVGIALVHLGRGAPRLVERVVAHAVEVFHREQLARA